MCSLSWKEERMQTEEAQIPAIFYQSILNGSITLPQSLRFYSLASMIVQQASGHLDPQQLGMTVNVVQCMPAVGAVGMEKVRSLRETVWMGTAPWNGEQEWNARLLGVESLAGQAVLRGHAVVMSIQMDEIFRCTHHEQHEQSAAACPIMRGNRVAGCLCASSTQANFFREEQLTLLQQYTNLLTLAFEPEEFYEVDVLALQPMPPTHVQRHYLSALQRQVLGMTIEADED